MELKHIIPILLVAALVVVAGCQQRDPDDHTIMTQGNAELKFKPDTAEIVVGVSVLKDSAKDAQAEASAITNAIVDGLRYKGIAESDIATDQLMLYEEYKWDENYREQTSAGWRATQTLRVTTSDLTKLGTIVDVAVEKGANQIQNINFKLSPAKELEYKKQALADATKNAKDKAEILAESSGYQLGELKTLSESNYYYAPYRYDMAAAKGGEEAVAMATNVLPQDVTITAMVSVVYYVK